MVFSRSIVHLDADAFFASVEQAADPRLRGKAIAVGGEKRGIIASASYEARRMGVYTPMPTVRARKLCPKLIVVPGDFEKYERFSRWMFSYAQDFTPDVEVGSIDEGYFDVTGARQSPVEIAETIRGAIRQSLKISVSEGIGPNKLISQIASKLRKPASFIRVPPGEEIPFLHPLENRWLPGVGPKTAGRLNAAGLAQIGQIAQTPLELLSLLLGGAARETKQFANGIDNRPVRSAPEPAKSYSQQETFGADTIDEDFVEATLRRMTDELLSKIRVDGKAVRTLTVKVRYNDMAEDRCGESLREPTDLESDVYGRLRPLLRQAWKRRVSLRLVSLKFSHVYDGFFRAELPLEPSSQQHEARRQLARAVDELRKTRGRYVVMRGHDLALRAKTSESTNSKSETNQTFGISNLPHCFGFRISKFEFIPLHVHSYYSFLDSTLSVEAVVKLAAHHQLPAIALTDTGNLHGAVEFVQTAKAHGIKPIIGAELDGKLYFVENATGYKNLCRLLSKKGSDTTGLIVENAADWPAVHYATPVDRLKYDIVQSIRTLTLLRQEHPEKRLGGEFHFAAETSLPRMKRAAEITERCNFEFELGKLQFPAFRPPDGSTPARFLHQRVMEGFYRRYPTRYRELEPQIETELAIIHEVGYEEYFLFVWDILQECQRRGIEWLTRGSAADSLVCYCLGISDVCPVRFKLYFRRFLNKERMKLNKLPDIDVDFPHDRKDDVIDLIFEKYGTEQAAVVGGFSTYQGRSALADVCKVLGVSEYQVRRFTEKIPHGHASDLEQTIATMPECRDLPVDEPPYSVALKVAGFLDGFPRYPKMHPCGIVLSREPMTDLTPCFRSEKGYPTTHFDMDSVEVIGLVKIDILAQGGLAAMRDVHETLVRRGIDITTRLPRQDQEMDDPAVWEMIASGGARAVHHIESPAMISLCRMCNVREIDGLIAIVSVIRPGAANGVKKTTFARRYQKFEPITYPHASLERCLQSTFGMVVYEEHILQICEAFAGLSPGRADVLRRALAKENAETIQIIGEEFARCARARGRSEQEIADVWDTLCGFHGYAFCKAHSTVYGIEAYQSAWLKHYYPVEFMAAVLSNGKGFYRSIVYVLECHRLGIPLLPPTVNEPGPMFAVMADQRIRVPLTRTKGVTERVQKRILAERERGAFMSITDFHRRVQPSREEMELLQRVGAFDEFGRSRTEQFWEILQLSENAGRLCESAPLFAASQKGPTVRPKIPLSAPSRRERLQAESELLDFPVSSHPLELYNEIAWDTYCPVAELGNHVGETVTCCGLIIEDRVHEQVTGEPMKFITLADWTGMIETELFAKTYRSYGLATVRYPVLEITATVMPYENGRGYSLRVHRAGKPRHQ
ncbi:MAG TPA: DNA polymerase III subunit alpha [Verrucomicrobiae bacterium]|nr:DNA polymerase III subunit alpha [Verrucomicrobiae bacterium]